jgi:hypothetical protein
MAKKQTRDFADQMTAELQQVASIEDFCKDWKEKWRPIAVAAQAICKIFFPPGAIVLGILIDLADKACPTM